MSDKQIETGGPAFPSIEQTDEWSENQGGYVPKFYTEGGMTLRDYFAAHAPITFDDIRGIMGSSFDPSRDMDRLAIIAVLAHARAEYADAMIAARGAK